MSLLHWITLKTPFVLTWVLLVNLVVGCGSDSNLMRALVSEDQLHTMAVYLSSARAAYDHGNLDKAWRLASNAYLLDPHSEEASILLGFIGLSIAGGDPFNLAKAMIQTNDSGSAKDQSALIADNNLEKTPADLAFNSEGDADTAQSTSSTLSSFQKAINITQDEILAMGELDKSDPELPLLKPKCAEAARKDVERLKFLEQAILVSCPFVDPEARIEPDFRQSCEPYAGVRNHRNQAHFLWAFTHLTEALIFNSVLNFGSADPTGKKSNLELRAEKIRNQQAKDPASIELLVQSIKSLESALENILPKTGTCSESAPTSQLRATLYDMLGVSAGFARLASIPPKIVGSIRSATEQLNSRGASLQTIRSDFTRKNSQNMAAKIDDLTKDPTQPLNNAQKTAICGSIGSINGGGMSIPDACK